jgi:hypothetical protein
MRHVHVRTLEGPCLMENVSGSVDGEYITTLLTLILAQIVDALLLHPEAPHFPGLSQRLLEEWYAGELSPDAKAHLSRQLSMAATEIASTAYPATRLDTIRRYARTFSTEFHRR